MRLSTWACAWAVTGCLFMGDAMAQELRQPFSVQPAGFDYNRYLQEESSPSDAPPPVSISDQAEGNHEHAESHAAPAAVGGSCCDTGCDSGCCSTGCSSCDWCCLGEAFSISSCLFSECSPWSVGGWTQFGYTQRSTGLFNNRPGKINLAQQWAWIEKEANGDCCWDWGFRADMMYGTDGYDTQAFGNNPGRWDFDNGFDHGPYAFALPQLYGVLEKGDLSIKFGHFFTLVGYEVVPAPDNFFYSHSYTMYNSEPFTHTGAIATYSVSDNLEVYGGWTAGWDTGFEQTDGGSNFLGGFSASLTDDLNLTYITTIGNFGFLGDDGYSHSVVLDATLTNRLNYVFQTDYLDVNSSGQLSYGINQYLFYTINDCLAAGARVEWWKYTDGIDNMHSLYEATFGINFRPHSNFVIRPEIRDNWAPSSQAAMNNGDVNTSIFGVDVIATY